VLQPVKGIELREEDRGEMVPNMGIEWTSSALSEAGRNSSPLSKWSHNKMKVLGQPSI